MLSRKMKGIRHALVALGFCVALASTLASAQPDCVGDCNGDCAVRINELITAVGISLGSNPLSACEAADANGNGAIAINELIQAVNNSLNGCPGCDVYNSTCNLAEDSTLTLRTGLLELVVFPTYADEEEGEVRPVAQVRMQCRDVAGGGLECDCSVGRFDAVNIPGIGEVCIAPHAPCDARPADCDGDTPLDVNVHADHNIGECSSREDCQNKCDVFCGDLGSGYFRQASTCEDFCIGGERDGQECGFNADCPGGACGGPDGGDDGHICECVCAEVGVGEPTQGNVSCSLGVAISVELDGSGVCGDIPPAITLAPVCGELTTGTSNARLDNVANMPGLSIEPAPVTGVPTTCENLRAGNIVGATLVGHLAFFGSAIGDILTENVFICEERQIP